MKAKVILIITSLFIVGLLTFLYSRFISTSGFIVKEYKLSNSKIESSYHGFKIVHISDIHYGSIINKKQLDKIVERINLIEPDIVIFTGDLFVVKDELDINLEEFGKSLSKIKATIGRYAINGNHDYEHIKEYEKVIKLSGFKDINDSYELIYKDSNKPIFLAGMSTNLYGTLSTSDKINPILEELEKVDSTYNILLLHEPDFIKEIDHSKFDLALSGHSHNGQVRFPILGAIYTPIGSKDYYDEHYKLDNTDLYISSGLGTSLLNLRFLNKPSFNYYRLTK